MKILKVSTVTEIIKFIRVIIQRSVVSLIAKLVYKQNMQYVNKLSLVINLCEIQNKAINKKEES